MCSVLLDIETFAEQDKTDMIIAAGSDELEVVLRSGRCSNEAFASQSVL
jgi:hypothetical protein